MFLRRWFKPRSSTLNLVGLDIDSDVIKLLRITTSDSKHKVESFAIATLPTGAIVKNEIKDYNSVSTILKDMFKQCRLNNSNIALAIPRSSAIIKNVTIDSRLNETEIESRAWIEANRNFPELVGDIYLDFNILGTSTQDPSQLDLILVACRKEQINPYLELLRQCNLVTKIVDVNCYALERALSILTHQLPPSGAVALLNLNFTLSTLIVTHEDQLIYAHDHSYDGSRLMNQIQKFLQDNVKKTNPAEVEQIVMIDPIYADILKENLSSHLRHTMHFFYSSRPNISIQKIILAGDCATIPNLSAFIRQETNIDTVVANPFENMTFASDINIEKIKTYAPTLMLCCGLALSHVE